MSKSITSPGLALLKLLVLVVSGMFLFSLLGLLVGSLFYKQSVLVVSPMNESVGFLRIVQLFSSVGSFLLPAWWFAKREGNQATSFFKLNTPTLVDAPTRRPASYPYPTILIHAIGCRFGYKFAYDCAYSGHWRRAAF